MVESNLNEDGSIPNFTKRNQAALVEYAKSNPVPGMNDSAALMAGVSNWTPLGQANPTIEAGDNWNGVGAIRCLEWSGSNIWAGSAGGGMWYGSFVSGSDYNWSARTDGLPNLSITDIEIAPTNTNILYALTGAVGSASGYRSTGVIKSTDAGATWQPTGLTFPDDGDTKGYRLLVSQTSSSIVWAATDDGMYRTTNGGTDWNLVPYVVEGGSTEVDMTGTHYDIAYKPGSSTTMYATSGAYFYISTNSGVSFTRVNRTDAGLPASGGRIQIGLTAANTSYVYLLYGNGSSYQGLYLSTNSGSTFSLRSSTPNMLGSQAWRNIAIAVSPSDATLVYVGGLDIYKSVNSGSTWTQISDQSTTDPLQFSHADIFELYCTASYLYAATDGGIYRMTRSTDNWVQIHKDMQTGQAYRIGVDPSASAAYVLTGLQDNGTYKNSGAVYLNVGGADGMETAVRPSDPDVVYVTSQDGNVVRSDDGGSNRTGIFSVATAGGLCGCTEDSRWVTNFTLRPGSDQQVFVGYKAVWFSTNQGVSGWTRITPAFVNTIHNIDFAKSDNTIFYATDGAAVARYNLSGTWSRTTVTGNLPSMSSITRVAVDPNDPAHVLISIGGYTDTRKVYETFNGTSGSPTWTNITRNLPNVPVNTVVMDDDAANTIYIGTDIGVFVTSDSSVNWLMYTNGLPTTRVYDLEINTLASPDYIFAGLFGRGVFKTPTYTGCSVSAAIGGTLEGLKYYEVSTDIVSTQLITGGTGTSVGYNAGSYVNLTPGFEVRGGSKFEAYIQGCTTAVKEPKPLRKETPDNPPPQ